MGGRGSLMHVGSEGWPVWSDPTDELLLLKLLKKLMLALIERRRWPGLMNHVFFYITWMAGCVRVSYLGNTWHQDALWEEGEAVSCSGQCSAEKPWVLPSMWMLL
ncbi:hypothetical protein QTP70_028053 [Hemibagrus guttatus]|uniref:Uncharacterized protein n=1 Tax=Hemibagrus guttatus TaxID=175788 RepID=A0AAE0UZ92_9TELE|nr:hypothetical protein QTP70_028053 [Hemibagrus guttatus]